MAITALGNSVSISTTEISLISGTSTLQSNTTTGVYQLFIDTDNMAAGDEYTIRIKEKIANTASTQVNIYSATLDGNQSSPFVTPSLVLANGWDMTMQQVTGTARTIHWSIRKVG
jgi:hypothetical protein